MAKAATPTTPVDEIAPVQGAQSTADLSHIATELARGMPDVQEHAIAQAASQQASAESAPKDKTGTLFNPDIHLTSSDGKPQLTVRGTFAQKRGRKPGSVHGAQVSASSMSAPGAQNVQSTQQAATEMAARTAGVQAAELVFAAGVIIGGDEWQPRKDDKIGMDERAMLQGAMGDYFVARGKCDIPPGVVLSFVMLAYIAPRFAMPKTQSRFAAVKAKLVSWWVNRKLRKMGLDTEVKAKKED